MRGSSDEREAGYAAAEPAATMHCSNRNHLFPRFLLASPVVKFHLDVVGVEGQK